MSARDREVCAIKRAATAAANAIADVLRERMPGRVLTLMAEGMTEEEAIDKARHETLQWLAGKDMR